MYEMEYVEGGYSLKDKCDFTTFLDKLAYELIFNDKFKKSSVFTKRSINEVDNSNSSTKKKRKFDDDDDDDACADGNDENYIHQIKSFSQMFPQEAKEFKQTVKHNCKVCNDNSHRTTYFCLNCSKTNENNEEKKIKGLFWICSPLSDSSSQCYARHVLGKK